MTTSRTYRIGSNNPLFFRNGNEASFGGDVFSKGYFPPTLSTIYGALRAAIFEKENELFSKRNEECDPTLQLKIKGFAIDFKDETLYPLPFDYTVIEGTNKCLIANKLILLERRGISSSEYNFLLKSLEQGKALVGDGYYTKSIAAYLSGYEIRSIKKINQLIPSQEITHNAIGQNGVVREGALYIHHQHELWKTNIPNKSNEGISQSEFSFLFKIEFPTDKLVLNTHDDTMLGSDGRPSFIHEEINDPFNFDPPALEENMIIRYYLLTHGIFENNQLPDFLDQGKHSGFEVLTYACGRSISIGGFDTEKKKPKPSYKAVPAGAVYYLKVLNADNASDTIQKYHGNSSSYVLKNEGYGIGYFGVNV